MAAEHAKLALPEITLGEFPATGGTQRLPRLVGLARAKSLMLLGEPVSAIEAKAFGLIDRVVPGSDLMRVALHLAGTVASRSGVAVAALKRALHDRLERPLREGLALEVALMEEVAASADAAEGYRAFLEKRPPRFNHR